LSTILCHNCSSQTNTPFTLRQVDLACADFAAIDDRLDFVMSQLARVPTRGGIARIALGIMFGAAVS
jgi:hypothetical protein